VAEREERRLGDCKGTTYTHCIIPKVEPRSTGMTGAAVVRPTRASWRKVLYLLMVVGRTSADGSEKSQ